MQNNKTLADEVMQQFSPCFKLLGEYMNTSKLKCSNCIHSRVSWFNRLIQNQYAYKCSKYTIPEKYDPVLGKTTPSEMGACSVARLDRDVCGPEALQWFPKDKSLMFDYIKHVDSLPKN